jgi:ubiquinone/menaquinone biosynthesis C-methylase UbiE
MHSIHYKKVEEHHYDSRYDEEKDYYNSDENKISITDKVTLASRKYIESKTFEVMRRFEGGEILDYGCSIGERSYIFASEKWKIIGIDISSKSVRVAEELRKRHNINAEYLVMDCEHTAFENNRFRIIYDFGTFSSLNMEASIREMCRVLAPDGYLLAIETLGDNPVFNLKRLLNVFRGIRTEWAASHIMRIKDWARLKEYFSSFEIKFFSLLTPYLIPLLMILPERSQSAVISFFEKIDDKLLRYDFLRRFAFKTVAIFHGPLKQNE